MVRLPEKSGDESGYEGLPTLADLSQEVKELVRLISSTDINELHLESGPVRIVIKRGGGPAPATAPDRAHTIHLVNAVPDIGGYPTKLIARLLYGCGLRVSEPLKLRIKDVDAGMKGLSGAGVKTMGEARSLPGMRYGFVEDPNGIRVELMDRSKP